MAEKDDSLCENDIREKLKKLDAQIKIPDIPDVSTVFEKSEEKKSNIKSFRGTRYIAAAAAVVLICVSIPFINATKDLSFAARSNEVAPQAMYADERSADAAPEEGAPEAAEPEEAYDEVVTGGGYFSSEGSPSEDEKSASDSVAQENPLGTEDGSCSLVADAALARYFSANDNGAASSETETKIADSFSKALNKKRSIDVEVAEDSVSVMLYDVSGISEILSAFWVEGIYQSSDMEGGYYIINVSKQITREDFESGDYLPYVGDAEAGVRAISCSDLAVSDIITKATVNMSVKLNIEDGTYVITAGLE